MSNYVHLEECEIKAETEKAFLIVYEDAEYWIPKGQMANPDDYKKGQTGRTVSITEWIAGEKGLE